MEQLKPLGRLDIFGILLPGTIPIFTGTYALFAVLAPFQLSIGNVLDREFLVTVLLFVGAYLIGSLLRLVAADVVDKQSSEYMLKVWKKQNEANLSRGYELDFKAKMADLSKGGDVSDVPVGFDNWLWLADEFPYAAHQNRVWRSQGFQEVLDFFQQKHKDKMWPGKTTNAKIFFNYCKLSIIDGGGTLADEVIAAEGLTRFFAGTYVALRLSAWLLLGSLLVQTFVIGLLLTPTVSLGPAVIADWKTQIIHCILSLGLICVLRWMCHRIIERFRIIRKKETDIVFHAFYLYVKRPYKHAEGGLIL
ncbi:MAG TPA: hypothetical protein PKZ84_16170 [Anaerolineae bacterium]|nr:hypothetical protein [Anaerolineae bacterium]HQI86176.1 hypothetical protein [Anaerolineae bacterium]